MISEKYLRDSIKSMQRFGNIPQTGLLDKATIELMNRKRCGVPDIIAPDDSLVVHRSKRYIIQGSKWSKTNLTWRFVYAIHFVYYAIIYSDSLFMSS